MHARFGRGVGAHTVARRGRGRVASHGDGGGLAAKMKVETWGVVADVGWEVVDVDVGGHVAERQMMTGVGQMGAGAVADGRVRIVDAMNVVEVGRMNLGEGSVGEIGFACGRGGFEGWRRGGRVVWRGA